MNTRQTIAVIGATENMGPTLSKNLSKGNYRLLLCAAEKKELLALANDIHKNNPAADIEVLDCTVNASWESDIIITATSHESQVEVAGKIKEVANQKIVVSIACAADENRNGFAAASRLGTAEQLQRLLPNSKVVKACSTSFSASPSSTANGVKTDVFITGNDGEALEAISELISVAGFNPVVVTTAATT